jgi:heme-degrading monooxygenase HmoA
MNERMRALVLTLTILGGCTTAPVYYRTVNEQAITLGKGDLEIGGIAFITPSTVTGQEQEKEAVALTFTDTLKSERPGLKVSTLAQTLGAVNRNGLADAYKRMYEEARDTGLFSAEVLRRVGAATGTRYLAQLKLLAFSQSSKGRFGFLGLRVVETQYADARVFFTIWDSRDGTVAWEAMQELRIARESTTEEPLMLRRVLEHSARELIARLP